MKTHRAYSLRVQALTVSATNYMKEMARHVPENHTGASGEILVPLARHVEKARPKLAPGLAASQKDAKALTQTQFPLILMLVLNGVLGVSLGPIARAVETEQLKPAPELVANRENAQALTKRRLK